ncbi:MAG: PQQ-binding-like beta-propeller repeat protein [Planctomycetia bacterium]|nr:PQQ-binding-like beta-propeller repeat protein [Planctomycetia bacterium]
MKTFACSHCGAQVRRPTAPLKCDACGQQRIGLFKEVKAAAGGSPAPPPPAPTPIAPKPVVAQPPPAKPTIAPPPAPLRPAAPVASAPASPSPPAPSTPAPKAAAPTRVQPPARSAPPPKPISPPSIPAKTASPSPPSTPPTPAARKPAAASSSPSAPTARIEPAKPAAPAPAATGPGSIAWRFPIQIPGQDYSAASLRNCPAVDEAGRIYAAVGRKLFALEERDGAIRSAWEYTTGGQIPGSPALGGDGRLRVHSGDGLLHCVTTSGEAAFPPADVGEPLGWASPVIDSQNNTWVCLYNGGLLRVDPRGVRGTTPFVRTRQKFDSTPLIRGGVLYVGAEDAYVYAIPLDASRGRNQWDHNGGHGKTEWFINSSPALSPQPALIVAGRDEFLYAFDLDGSLLWRLHLRGQMLGSPIVTADGDVLVGVSLQRRGEAGQGKLVCVDGRAHRVRWEYKAEGPIESTPVLGSDGVAYFGDNHGAVHAVDAGGQKVWIANVGSAVRSAGAIVGPGRLVFGLDTGTLVALACSSPGVATGGWPKYMGTLGQSGYVTG